MQQNCKIIKSKNIYIKDNILIIEIKPVELENNEIFELIICQNLPLEADKSNIIKISNNNKLISLHNNTGNFTRADQIKTRTRYPLIYGIDPIHISLVYRIYPSKFNYNKLEKEN